MSVFFCFPAEVLNAEGGVFGVHAFSGDALHLGLKHLVGILVGLVEHPDLQEGVQKASRGEELAGILRQGRDGRELLLVPLSHGDLCVTNSTPCHQSFSDSIPRLS